MEEAIETIRVDVPTIDAEGNKIVLKGIPAERERSTGRLSIDPKVVAQADAERIAALFELKGRQVPEVLTLYAQAGFFRQGVIPELSRFHKMLFYQWKRLEGIGLGPAFLHDEFHGARGGPVSIHLKDDLKELAAAGLVKVAWSEGVEDPTVVELTEAGMELAARLWRASPEPVREVSIEVKSDLLPASGRAIRERVHLEHPKDRKIYSKRRRVSPIGA